MGPTTFCLALPACAVAAECGGYRPARHDSAMAPGGVPLLLAVEVTFARWQAQGSDRGSQPDPADELGEPIVGRAAHSWGVCTEF